MLKIMVSLILGSWGLKILEFYIHNSSIINSIVFLYGVFLVFSHVNYKRITGKWMAKRRCGGTYKKRIQTIGKGNQDNSIPVHRRECQLGNPQDTLKSCFLFKQG